MEPERKRGELKIFFSYVPGAGETEAMLLAGCQAAKRGEDVVAAILPEEAGQAGADCLAQLEVLPPVKTEKGGMPCLEFDLDGAVKRRPGLLLLGDLAHINGDSSRHYRRYQDVEELLNAGIHVYTTLDVIHIESLSDRVTAITGKRIIRRIPDRIFDEADQVEMRDAEPGDVTKGLSREEETGFSLDQLTALRELALRRCADRLSQRGEEERNKNHTDYYAGEHVLVCLSPAPSNVRIIRTAARMAHAFHGSFTALYVETAEFSSLEKEDRRRLQDNMRLARQLGAEIETVAGDDVAFQIAEYARLSGVTRIVVGHSAARRHFFRQLSLTDRLILLAPGMDIHIIPDMMNQTAAYRENREPEKKKGWFQPWDLAKTAAALLAATGIGRIFAWLGFTDANIITVYILGVLIVSVVTSSRVWSVAASLCSVVIFNFFFTEPRYTLLAYESGYPVTFLVMFAVSFITGSLAARLKDQARQTAKAAYRTKILFDTNQLLQQARGQEEITRAAAGQLVKLLNRDIAVYLPEGEGLGEPLYFTAASSGEEEGGEEKETAMAAAKEQEGAKPAAEEAEEREAAVWALKNNKHAGAGTDTFSGARYQYLAIRVNHNVYGVAGVCLEDGALDPFENGMLLSILGEWALALENEKNAREKEEAAIMAKNEQMRANFLRTISHDLRTPLTSISGNASNLLDNNLSFDEETKRSLYQAIYDDAMWLAGLVENLLSVTRIEEGRVQLSMTAELMDEVISEALHHVRMARGSRQIRVEDTEEFIFARMDPKLIMQVIINIVDNALKYTPDGSEIVLSARREQSQVVVQIRDNGPGIPDGQKAKIFDMFYTGTQRAADSRRSLGLGLSLCRSIIHAHGGEITVTDAVPHGAVFTFTLPAGEVQLHG